MKWHDYPHCHKLRDEKDERIVKATIYRLHNGQYQAWSQGWCLGRWAKLAKAMKRCERRAK